MKRRRSHLLVLLCTIVLASVLVQMLPHGSLYADDQKKDEIVAFNTKSHKYHCLECTWAKKCTVNCVNIPMSEAIRRGGVPCKVCGGTCRSKPVSCSRFGREEERISGGKCPGVAHATN